MKKARKYVLGIMIAVLVVGAHVPQADAAFGVLNMQSNQFRVQHMSQADVNRLIGLLTQLRDRLQQLLQLRTQDYSDSEIEIATRSAVDVQEEEAELRGRVVDFGRSDYADVWFQYGERASNLEKSTIKERIDEGDDEEFQRRITRLDEDTLYYFRAVGEDDEGEREYGAVVSFRTDESNQTQDEEPSVTTRSAIDVDDDSAWLRGTVDMNDFRNGEVFFVYGEDESQVEDVSDDFDSYADVEEDGDDLQKVRVDSDLDGSDSYTEEVTSLDDNTEYYFSICVGYEDEDADDVVKCGSVRSFTTD